MHVKKGTTPIFLIVHIIVASISLVIGGWQAQACAQTVLSPAPFTQAYKPSFVSASEPVPALDPVAPPPAQSQEYETGEGAPGDRQFHIPLILNESVESQIEFFTTQGRTVFQSWLNRSARYLPIMKQIFREFNLPEDLVYIAMIESGFNTHAVSPKKAVGPWQFLKATAREYGLNINNWVDERRDPIKSTRAAAAHFKDLYRKFGSWALAVASYNAGMGRMEGAIRKARSDDFWEIRSSPFMHNETQEYVPRYLAAMMIAKDPGAYGFKDPEPKSFEYDEVVVPKSTDLRSIAASSGCSYQQILELNPELLRTETPQCDYVLRVPAGSRQAFDEHIVTASVRKKKARKEQDPVEMNGLLFLRMQSSSQTAISPARTTPLNIMSRYGTDWELKQTPEPAPAMR